MRKIFIAILIMITCESSQAFTPEQPIMKLNQVRPGMTGHALTVLNN